MKIKYVYTGSWFPRTKLHLREIYNFLKYQYVEIVKDEKSLFQALKKLKVKDVRYEGGVFDRVIAGSGDIVMEYEEDGLLLLRTDSGKWPQDHLRLDAFYQGSITPILAGLFGRGAPTLELIRTGIRVKPTIVVASQANKNEIAPFFAKVNDAPHFAVKKNGLAVHFGDKVILIISNQPDSEAVHYLIRFYTFFREYEAYLYRFMLVDRRIWDRINAIREARAIKGQDLPQIRDNLIVYKRDVAAIKLRLSQMDDYIKERRRDMAQKNLAQLMEEFRAVRFEKMASIQEHVTELINTTEKYVDDAVNLLELLYQENQQRQISTLQVLFLIGAVANVIVLGTLPSSTVKLFDLMGRPAGSATIIDFDFVSMIQFGAFSLAISILLFLIWNYIFRRIRLSRAVSLLEKPNEKR